MGENQEFIAHISVMVFKYSLTIEFKYKTLSEILTEMIWLKTNMETRVYTENLIRIDFYNTLKKRVIRVKLNLKYLYVLNQFIGCWVVICKKLYVNIRFQ